MNELERIAAAHEAARAAVRRFNEQVDQIESWARLDEDRIRGIDALEAERRQAAAVGEHRNLFPESRAEQIAELRRQAVAAVDEHMATAEHYRGRLDERTAAKAPTGADALAARIEAASAADRVRSLIGQGHDPLDLLARAEQLGDRTMVRALRTEAEWQLSNDETGLDAAVARRLGIGEDRPFKSLADLRRAFDAAELDLIPDGKERTALAARLQADREYPVIEQELTTIRERIDQGGNGLTLQDAVELRFARQDAGVDQAEASDGDASGADSNTGEAA